MRGTGTGRGTGATLACAFALVLAACAEGPLAAPDVALDEPLATATCEDRAATGDATGAVVAAHADEPAAWHPAFHGDAAAVDLQSLWGLPLYAYDEAGQLRPGLVREATVVGRTDAGWTVRLGLCPGSWSDGEPVVAADVAATVDALRSSPSPWLAAPVAGVRVDGSDVLVDFAAEQGRWQHVLAELGSILPAHVLAADGLEAYRDDVPVSGGPFALGEVVPGYSRTFTAHVGGPLGSPGLGSIEVLLVPRFELALGLLVEDSVDVLLGHLPLEGRVRIEAHEGSGIDGALARGNTLLTWRWNEGAAIADPDLRARVQEGIDLTRLAQGLLRDEGSLARSFVPAVPGPPVPAPQSLPAGVGELVVASPRWHEVPSLVSRAARDSLERRGATIRTAGDEADELARTPLGDVTIMIRRLGPWPSTAAFAGGEGVQAADEAAWAGAEAVAAGQDALWSRGVEVPLVELGVAHAWRAEVLGVRPSGWPGIGFASAIEWDLAE